MQNSPVSPGLADTTSAVTVLVVDDEPGMRSMLSFVLTQFGHKVITAHNGVSALELVRRRRDETIDVLLTDLAMPGMNGAELADLLSERIPALKVIFTSGFPAAVAEGFGINVARDTFLPKPIDVAKLKGTIENLALKRAA